MVECIQNVAKSPHEVFQQEGILPYPRLLEGDELEQIRAACERILSCFLKDHDADASGRGLDANNMRHLNDPRWSSYQPKDRDLIMELAADPRCVGPVEQIFGGPSQFRCSTLWFNPRGQSRDGDWHRDQQFVLPDEDAVMEYFARKNTGQAMPAEGVQFQVALVDNDDVEYVPFSPGRYDTPEEYHIRCADGRIHNRDPGMPNAVRVRLRAGDAVIFNAAGLHRGRYHTDKPRRTLMLTYTPRDTPCFDNFSSQPWMLESGYLDSLSPRSRAYFQEFIDTYRDSWVAASQDPPGYSCI